MKKSLILSRYRTEFRRKKASYRTEVKTLRWVRLFLDELSIIHSSQIRRWQIDYFLSEQKKRGSSYDELLQAKSALRFLFDKVLIRSGIDETAEEDQLQSEPGSFRITA